MQKLIACTALSAEKKINELMAEGWMIIPETMKVVPGFPVLIPESDRTKGGPVHKNVTMFFGILNSP